jgi:hypothetical protein
MITMRGKWVAVEETAVRFSVPGFVDKRVVEPVVRFLPDEEVMEEVLGQTHILDPSVPREITAPIVTALNNFHRASEEVYRKHAAILDKAHDALAHATDLRFGTLDRITDRLIGKDSGAPRMAAMYAVRRALITAGMGFGTDRRSHRTTGVFQIRSKEQIKYVTTAVEWLRQYQEFEVAKKMQPDIDETKLRKPKGVSVVQGFINKARKAIIESRKHRSAEYIGYGAIGPSDKRFPIDSPNGTLRYRPGVSFSEDERVLIRVLEYAGVQWIIETEESLQSLLPLILRGTGMYSEEPVDIILGRRAIFALLLEIGVFHPYEDITHYDVNLLLPSSQHSKPLQQLATTLDQLDRTKVDLRDSMHDIRRDLRGTTAFAIDSIGSQEIDDAISITSVPGDDSKAWLHAHIANPTAFIGRDSVFARMAAHLTETFYAPDRTVPLLPSWISQEMFSLKAGRPCLTISALVDDQGEILDIKLEHSKLGDVVSLDYKHLPELIGIPQEFNDKLDPMIVGGELPVGQPVAPPTLTPKQAADLKLLHKFTKARASHRARNNAYNYSFRQPDVSVHSRAGKSGLQETYPHRTRGIMVEGDPIIAIYPRPYENPFQALAGTKADNVVQEMMLLAGEVFGRWCQLRDIPLAYRSISTLPGEPSYKETYDTYIKTALDKHGYIPVGVGFRFNEKSGIGSMQTTPAPHFNLGLSMYTKITSPLRRYGDMIAHWQVEAALREEARAGHSNLLTTKRQDYLPFTHPQMENIISRLHPRERLLATSKQRSIRHWISHWFFRAHYFNEYPLPPTMKVIIMRSAQVLTGAKSSFNMAAWMDTSLILKIRPQDMEGNMVQYGDIWEADIETVVPYYPDTILRPLKLLHREEEMM